jgi:hypothetical protein
MKSNISSFQVAGRGAADRMRWRTLAFALIAAATGFGGPAGPAARAESGVSKEYQVKAGFLFNFVQFVDWPAESFPSPDAPIVIGVLGVDPFGSALDEIVQGQTAKNRSIVVRRSGALEQLEGCHMLFISASEKERIGQIHAALENKPVLAVGELPGFADRGGIINFFLQGGKVRFEINAEAAKRRGLKISSQLLSLGRIVGKEKGKGMQ